jgi:hypothetical protein
MIAVSTSIKKIAPQLLFINLFGLLFTDLPLEAFIGTIGRCPMLFVAPLTFFYIQSHYATLQTVKPAKIIYQYAVVSTIAAVVMVFITLIFYTYGNLYIYGEFIPVKLIKAASYNFINAIVIYNLYVLSWHVSVETIYKILNICFWFLTLYGIVEMFIPFPIPGIHATLPQEDIKRLQLTTAEPVTATIIYATFLALILYLRIYLNKRKVISALIFLTGIVMLLIIQSKGGVILLVVAIIITLRKKINFKIFIIGLLLLIPIIYYIINIILVQILIDIDNFTSFSTRVTTFFAPFIALFKYPIGQGYGTYKFYFSQLLIPLCNNLSQLLNIPLNTEEMDESILTGKYLGPKSGMASEVMFNGVIAIIFIYKFCKYNVQQFKKIILPEGYYFMSFIFYFLFLEFLFLVTFETMYFIFLPIMVIDTILNEKKFLFTNTK